MSWSGVLKFFTGLLLAFVVLAGSGFLAAQFFIAKLSTPPPKPTYPNDKPAPPPKPTATKAKPAASEKPPEEVDAPAPKPLPAGAFEGRVTQQIGLILRDAPGRDSGQTGGIEYNDRVVVLETSPDGEWQKVRLQTGDREGWVKAGNIEKAN